MDFATIDSQRHAARVSQAALCREAGIHTTTYQRLLADPQSGRARTLTKLAEALTRLTTAAKKETAA